MNAPRRGAVSTIKGGSVSGPVETGPVEVTPLVGEATVPLLLPAVVEVVV